MLCVHIITDRTNVSDRNAMYILSATVQLIVHNIQDFTLSRESIRQARREYRQKIADEKKFVICSDYSIDSSLGRKIASNS